MEVLIEQDGIKLSCQPFLKNKKSLMEEGRTNFPRFIEESSDKPWAHKMSGIYGTLHRIATQTSEEKFSTIRSTLPA